MSFARPSKLWLYGLGKAVRGGMAPCEPFVAVVIVESV